MEYQVRQRVAAKLSVLSSKTHGEIGTGGLRFAIDESAPQSARAFSDIVFRLFPTIAYVAVAAWGMTHLDAGISAAAHSHTIAVTAPSDRTVMASGGT